MSRAGAWRRLNFCVASRAAPRRSEPPGTRRRHLLPLCRHRGLLPLGALRPPQPRPTHRSDPPAWAALRRALIKFNIATGRVLSASGSAGSRAMAYDEAGQADDDSLLGEPWPEDEAACNSMETNAYCSWIGVTCCCQDDGEVDEELDKCEWCQAVNGSLRGSVSAVSLRGVGLLVGAAPPRCLCACWSMPAALPGVRHCRRRPACSGSALPCAAPAGQDAPDI